MAQSRAGGVKRPTVHMRPLTVLTGIVLGSSVATTFGLARARPWRRWAQAAMWSALVALGALYWSTRG